MQSPDCCFFLSRIFREQSFIDLCVGPLLDSHLVLTGQTGCVCVCVLVSGQLSSLGCVCWEWTGWPLCVCVCLAGRLGVGELERGVCAVTVKVLTVSLPAVQELHQSVLADCRPDDDAHGRWREGPLGVLV